MADELTQARKANKSSRPNERTTKMRQYMRSHIQMVAKVPKVDSTAMSSGARSVSWGGVVTAMVEDSIANFRLAALRKECKNVRTCLEGFQKEELMRIKTRTFCCRLAPRKGKGKGTGTGTVLEISKVPRAGTAAVRCHLPPDEMR